MRGRRVHAFSVPQVRPRPVFPHRARQEQRGAVPARLQRRRMSHMCQKRLQPGAPCDNLHGYCDVFHRCRPLDAEGPITRLQWLVFGHKGITNVLLKYWYLTSLGFLITSVLTVLLVRVCSTYTPSSNPQLSPNKKILSDSIRHPLDNLLGHFRRDI